MAAAWALQIEIVGVHCLPALPQSADSSFRVFHAVLQLHDATQPGCCSCAVLCAAEQLWPLHSNYHGAVLLGLSVATFVRWLGGCSSQGVQLNTNKVRFIATDGCSVTWLLFISSYYQSY